MIAIYSIDFERLNLEYLSFCLTYWQVLYRNLAPIGENALTKQKEKKTERFDKNTCQVQYAVGAFEKRAQTRGNEDKTFPKLFFLFVCFLFCLCADFFVILSFFQIFFLSLSLPSICI